MKFAKIKSEPLSMLPVSVILGNPRINCARLGICSIEGTDERYALSQQLGHSRNHRLVSAFVAKAGDHTIHFFFPKTGMMPLAERMFFGKEVFIVEVEKEIPSNLCDQIGIPQDTTLLSGKWPIEATETGYRVSIACASAFEEVPVFEHTSVVNH